MYLRVSLLAALIGGCGLVDSNVTDFDISLPQKTLSVDSQQWQLSSGSLPEVPCTENTTCDAIVGNFCEADECSSTCDGSFCQLHVDIGLFKDFSLKDENPALQDLDDAALISVSVSQIFYEVELNTLSVATPPLEIYLAPLTVMDSDNSDAIFIGTIPEVAPQTIILEGELELEPEGEEAVRDFLTNWATPFNIILTGVVTVSAGDMLPTGRLDAAVRVNAVAGLR